MGRECACDVKLLRHFRLQELLGVSRKEKGPSSEHVPIPDQPAGLCREGCRCHQREDPREEDDHGGDVKVEQDVEGVVQGREDYHQREHDGEGEWVGEEVQHCVGHQLAEVVQLLLRSEIEQAEKRWEMS